LSVSADQDQGILVVLRKVIEDLGPASLRADEHAYVASRALRIAHRPTNAQADCAPVVMVDSPVDERPALTAAHCVSGGGGGGIALHQKRIGPPFVTLSFSGSVSPRHERRTCHRTAIGLV
jgi:hypothetical protein